MQYKVYSAYMNVLINLLDIKDKKYAEKVRLTSSAIIKKSEKEDKQASKASGNESSVEIIAETVGTGKKDTPPEEKVEAPVENAGATK